MARRTIHNSLNTLDVGLPRTIGTSVGMGNLDTKGNTLVAKIALSHPLHLLAGNLDLPNCIDSFYILA